VFLGALDSAANASAFKVTHLDDPFLVVGKKAVLLSRSICFQSNHSISPRLVAVFIVKTITGQITSSTHFAIPCLIGFVQWIAPSNMIDQIGGWSSSSVGASSGKGYELPLLAKWMKMDIA
jgi:hypothetical protein